MQNLPILCCLVLVGCVGTLEQDYASFEPGGPTPPAGDGSGSDDGLAAAKQMFDTTVFPILSARCAGCHGEAASGFVAADPADGWDLATSDPTLVGTFAPTTAPILMKVKPSHRGVTYTADEESKITAWLSMELDLRDTQEPTTPPPMTTTPPPTVGCDTAVATTTSGRHNPGQACLNCHSSAGGETPFTIGGTLYKGANGTTPIVGATIHLVDANGKDIPLVTAVNGNFWTTQAVVFPVTVKASRCPDTLAMVAPVTAAGGNCNMGGCHVAGARVYLP